MVVYYLDLLLLLFLSFIINIILYHSYSKVSLSRKYIQCSHKIHFLFVCVLVFTFAITSLNQFSQLNRFSGRKGWCRYSQLCRK